MCPFACTEGVLPVTQRELWPIGERRCQLVRRGSARDDAAKSSAPREDEFMTTHRSLATLAILATAGIALIGSAGVANASPQDDAYLAALRGVGLHWTPGTQAGLIQEAHDVCYNLTWGWTPQRIANDLEARLGAQGVTGGKPPPWSTRRTGSTVPETSATPPRCARERTRVMCLFGIVNYGERGRTSHPVCRHGLDGMT